MRSIFAGFMVTMENDTWAAGVFVFNEMIQVTVGLIQETEVCLVAQKRKEVLEGQTRHRNPFFKRIDLFLARTVSFFLQCLGKVLHPDYCTKPRNL